MDKQINHSRVFKAGEKEEFIATDDRPDFDAACRMAMNYAKRLFGLDSIGYMNNVIDNECTTDSICTEFVWFRQHGVHCEYGFNVWVERNSNG